MNKLINIVIVTLLLITGVTIIGCGYSKECNKSPLEEYNRYMR